MRRLALLLTAFFTLLTASFGLAPASRAAWVWPVSGDVITPYRNGTDPYANGQHRGIDIAAPVGTPIVAAASGEVRFAGTAGSSGLTISIRTGDGYDTSYLHLSSLAVRAGAHVSPGERIGAVGTSGTRSATAPHLHFGVRDAGTRHEYHDPLAFLPPPPPPARAPEPPAPAPATAPEPAPPPAAPVTVPRVAPRPRAFPRARRDPVPHSRPHPVPHARPHPVPRAVPLVRRHAAPRAAPAPGALPAPRGSPEGAPARRSAPRAAIEPGTAPRRLSTLGRAARAPSMPSREPHPLRARRAPHRAAGPDIGWIGACIGLLLAAGLLGLTGERGTPTSTRIRALVRPLVAQR